MSLSNTNTEQITLTGHSPSVEILKFIEKIDRNLLLPCPRTADDLQMPDKNTIPREMNSFIVFRRQLAHVAKQLKTSDDGRVISKAASVIWRGASKSEKQSYTQIAEELKKRHREKYPNYTYERRKRKTAGDDFIVIDAGTIIQDRKKKRPRKSPPKSSAVHVSEEEQECAPIPTIMQEQGNGAWLQFNPLTSQVDNFIYSNNIDDDCFPCPEYQSFRDEQIPQLYQTLTSLNYTDESAQPQLLLFLQQSQQSTQQLSPTFDEFNFNSFYHGSSDAGIQSSFEGLEIPIDNLINFNIQ